MGHEHPTDVSEAEQAAQEGVGSGDEGYNGPCNDCEAAIRQAADGSASHVPPFTPLPGRVLTQVTHAQARTLLDALPPKGKRTAEDNVTADVLGYALKQPEAPREDGDWGYNATGPQS